MPDSAAAARARRPWPEWVTLVARLLLGSVLLIAGLLKVPHLDASVLSVRLYQLLPWETTTFVGVALPIVEIAVGLLILTGTFTRLSAVAGSVLMVVFILGIASVWARGISIDCGCFGGGGEVAPGETQYPAEIARDAGLLLAGLWAAWRPRSPLAVDNWLLAPVGPPEPEPTNPEHAHDKEPAR